MQCKNKKCAAELPDGAVFCHVCGRKQTTTQRKKVRGNGQGCVYQLPNGKWRATKTVGYELIPDSDPPRYVQKRITRSDFTKKSDAVSFLPILGTVMDTRNTKLTKIDEVPPDKTLTTLKELYDLWQPTHQRSQSTMNCYSAGFAVFKECWNIAMKEQDIDDLQECMDTCGKGRRTRENAKAVLGLVYKWGIPRGYVPPNLAGQPNLAEFLKIGDGQKGHKDGLNKSELEIIRKSVGIVPYADYIYCHCFLGFRPSAFIALDVSDYNRKEKAFVGGIKTAAGIDRTVTVSPKIQPIINRLVKDRISGPVFPDLNTGKPLTIRQYRDAFYAALDAMGIQAISDPPHRLTPHSCRHTFATLMKSVNAPEKDKLKLIGHTSVEMLQHYQDVDYDDLRRITNVI